ncbi:MAG: transglycosylase SLT domain-containing protein [Gammaproteobacteria bacterium]|nr:transglycosylase SLT domain-containing protein [Gammaproteobacteria bacterium]
MKLKYILPFLAPFFILFIFSSCTTPPPHHVENICSIFRQYPDWYWNAQKVEKRWGLPIPVLMAVVYQESRFNATAKPPREKLLWIIPWCRPTTAYGYSQALKETWYLYKRDTGHNGADRDTFADAVDFIGWYANLAHRRVGISKANAYQVYLAYHEGTGGYAQKTYLKKSWLIQVARNVQRRAWIYRTQLDQCRTSLPTKPWWRIW